MGVLMVLQQSDTETEQTEPERDRETERERERARESSRQIDIQIDRRGPNRRGPETSVWGMASSDLDETWGKFLLQASRSFLYGSGTSEKNPEFLKNQFLISMKIRKIPITFPYISFNGLI